MLLSLCLCQIRLRLEGRRLLQGKRRNIQISQPIYGLRTDSGIILNRAQGSHVPIVLRHRSIPNKPLSMSILCKVYVNVNVNINVNSIVSFTFKFSDSVSVIVGSIKKESSCYLLPKQVSQHTKYL